MKFLKMTAPQMCLLKRTVKSLWLGRDLILAIQGAESGELKLPPVIFAREFCLEQGKSSFL